MREKGFQNLVVGVTGNVMEDDIAEFLAAGADLVLPKPLKIQTLDRLLQFIDANSPTSMPGMKLAEQDRQLFWKAI